MVESVDRGCAIPPADPGPGAHLYLHIPYCTAKCPYCDFNSIAGRQAEYAAYVDALLAEVASLPHGPYGTIFMGGGTPTVLGPDLLQRLLVGLRRHLDLRPGYEWTCEANPGSADAATFQALAEHGVNRLSLGVQAVQDHHLRFLGRVHDHDEALAAVELACATVARVSADVIIGLPEQTDAELDATIALYRRFQLDHASVYHLAIEPGTEFAARHRRGDLATLPEERSAELLDRAWTGLAGAGLMPYETSNFCRAGQACRHNLAYWTRRDYQAAGAGAVSTVGRHRHTRQPHPGHYIAAVRGDGPLLWRHEELSDQEILTEVWMLGLRLAAGVAVDDLVAAGDRLDRWAPLVERHAAAGLLRWAGGRIALTTAGRAVQDAVTVALMPSD